MNEDFNEIEKIKEEFENKMNLYFQIISTTSQQIIEPPKYTDESYADAYPKPKPFQRVIGKIIIPKT